MPRRRLAARFGRRLRRGAAEPAAEPAPPGAAAATAAVVPSPRRHQQRPSTQARRGRQALPELAPFILDLAAAVRDPDCLRRAGPHGKSSRGRRFGRECLGNVIRLRLPNDVRPGRGNVGPRRRPRRLLRRRGAHGIRNDIGRRTWNGLLWIAWHWLAPGLAVREPNAAPSRFVPGPRRGDGRGRIAKSSEGNQSSGGRKTKSAEGKQNRSRRGMLRIFNVLYRHRDPRASRFSTDR